MAIGHTLLNSVWAGGGWRVAALVKVLVSGCMGLDRLGDHTRPQALQVTSLGGRWGSLDAYPVVCSVPLFLEYEDVLLRPQQLAAAGLGEKDVVNFLDVLAGVVQRVSIQFLWRPQLRDPNDDLVLEVAVNAQGLGQPVCILTFNQRDFLPQARLFGVGICTPQQFFQGACNGFTQ